MKIYATLRTLGLISVVIFGLFFCVCRRTICVCELYVFTLCKRRSLLTLLHTHKRCGFCLRKARVPDTNSIIFIVFYVCVEKKKASGNSKRALEVGQNIEYHCLSETKSL